MITSVSNKDIILELYDIGAIKFGEFEFKSGIISPIYMDLRLFISYPRFLKQIVERYADILSKLEYDRLAAIPYASLPIAGAISLVTERPWVFARKEQKYYGTKQLIEGKFNKGDRVVMIDDVITKGDSKIEALWPLEKSGLKVKDIVVLIDYEKGGSKLMKSKGYNVHSAMTMKEVLKTLYDEKAIDKKTYDKVKKFLSQ